MSSQCLEYAQSQVLRTKRSAYVWAVLALSGAGVPLAEAFGLLGAMGWGSGWPLRLRRAAAPALHDGMSKFEDQISEEVCLSKTAHGIGSTFCYALHRRATAIGHSTTISECVHKHVLAHLLPRVCAPRLRLFGTRKRWGVCGGARPSPVYVC